MNFELRTWKVSKTREGKPKVTLYRDGIPALSVPVSSVKAGNRLGSTWGDSNL